MHADIGNGRLEDDIDDDIDTADDDDDVMLCDDDDDDDNIGDISVETNVEELVARIESNQGNEAQRRKEIRRRLEEIEERRREARELDNTYNFNLDDDF